MTDRPVDGAELVKLAHVLGVPVERLSALAEVPPQDLRTLRRQVGDALFQADRHHFAKVAALSKAVPPAVAAKVTEHTMPPLLAARTAELLDPQRAVELVKRLPDSYVADVAVAMDPGRSAQVIVRIPPELIARVAGELARRGEWVVIGGFVSYVSPAGLAASVERLDGEQLLRVSFVLDDPNRLDDIAALLTDRQLDQMLAASAEHGLWRELGGLLDNVGAPGHARLADRLAAGPDQLAEAVRQAAERGELGTAAQAGLIGAG